MKANWLEGDALGAPISAAVLEAQGVYYRALDPANYQPDLDGLRESNGYVHQDEVSLTPETPNLQGALSKFADEHLHTEDEVRFVLGGSGVFDIRSQDDRWMRVQVDAGDLIVVPKDRHHRFFLTEARTIRCVRLFQDKEGWVPHYRAGGCAPAGGG